MGKQEVADAAISSAIGHTVRRVRDLSRVACLRVVRGQVIEKN